MSYCRRLGPGMREKEKRETPRKRAKPFLEKVWNGGRGFIEKGTRIVWILENVKKLVGLRTRRVRDDLHAGKLGFTS